MLCFNVIAMNRLLIFLLFLVLQSEVIGQTTVLVSVEGAVQDFANGKKLYGATVNVIQNGVSISQVISEDNGTYFVSAKVNPLQLMAIVIAKDGYMTKKMSFDLKTLVPKSSSTSVIKLLNNLPLQLYENRPNVDLAFTKETYAEKFVWDQAIYKAIPDAQVKADMDKKVMELYKSASDKAKTTAFVSIADLAVSQKEYDKAVQYYDSALVVSPSDPGITQKKLSVQTIIQINENEAKRKIEFDRLKTEGDLAFDAKNWVDAEKKYKLADQQIPKDTYIVSRLTKITEIVADEKKNASNKLEFDKQMQAAAGLVTSKKYPEAIAKYNEAIKLQPSQKEKVEAEITKIKNTQQDITTETEVKKMLKQAGDLYTQKKYDPSIEMYKKADAQIALFKKQALIDQYSKELQAGMKKVTDWKNSQDQVYKDQLEKANDNFLKGPTGYAKAKEILNSTPMKSRSTEPSVVELNDKIAKMEAYYKDRKAAYTTVKSKNNAQALTQLKAVQLLANGHSKYLPATELPQLQKSIDSLELIILPSVVQVVPTKTVQQDEVVGTQLKAPGERTNGTSDQAFNDLNATKDQKAERPQEEIQEIKNVFDYQNHFNKTVDEIQKVSTGNEIEAFKSEQTILERKNQLESDQRQNDMQKELQKNEVAISDRNKIQEEIQQKNGEHITDWKNAKDVLNAKEQKAADQNVETQQTLSNRVSNEADLRSEELKVKEQKVLVAQEQMKTNHEIAVTKKIDENAEIQEQQHLKIEKLAESKLELNHTPNNLKDEDGVLFPKNAMTERTYTIKNDQNHVTTVIVRRVVVDKTGYGVVFEQTTNESGINSFTRDGAVITDYIWFNESTGANVIEK
jgi:hypothetical protein